MLERGQTTIYIVLMLSKRRLKFVEVSHDLLELRTARLRLVLARSGDEDATRRVRDEGTFALEHVDGSLHGQQGDTVRLC